jgi:hypothetical protein
MQTAAHRLRAFANLGVRGIVLSPRGKIAVIWGLA